MLGTTVAPIRGTGHVFEEPMLSSFVCIMYASELAHDSLGVVSSDEVHPPKEIISWVSETVEETTAPAAPTLEGAPEP